MLLVNDVMNRGEAGRRPRRLICGAGVDASLHARYVAEQASLSGDPAGGVALHQFLNLGDRRQVGISVDGMLQAGGGHRKL